MTDQSPFRPADYVETTPRRAVMEPQAAPLWGGGDEETFPAQYGPAEGEFAARRGFAEGEFPAQYGPAEGEFAARRGFAEDEFPAQYGPAE
ncbi:hypothetical protein ACWCYY_38775, partial [Kitasatospora sp. NPDC001664]